MSIFEQIAGALGGPRKAEQQLDRYAQGQANFDDPRSPDFQSWNELVGAAPPQVTQDAFTQAARQVDPREYYEHVTPGARGTDPLGGLGRGALGTLAGALMGQLMNGGLGGLGGLTGMGGRQQPDLSQMIPGLRTTDPRQMSPDEVAALANYMRQHHPEAFGRAAAEVGQREPSLLESLLGNKALMMGAAALGAKLLADRAARQRAQGGGRGGLF